MKTASKVFIIIGIVFSSLMAFVWFISLFSNLYYLGYTILIGVALILFSATGIIVGALSLNRLNQVTQKKELTGTAVCCLIFCNTVAGILMLCMKDSDLEPTTTSGQFEQGENRPVEPNYLFKNNTTIQPNNSYTPYTNVNSQDTPKDAIIERLKQLKELKDNEVITEEEFAKMKADLLNKF